jgi:5-methylcytosine-specific restriction endonuclease McrA
VRVSQIKAEGPIDDFIEYWEGDNNNHTPVKIRVFTTRATKMLVWQRDKGRCAACGSNQDLEFNYIIPYSKGGLSTDENIQLLCQNCNLLQSEIKFEKTL